MMPSGRQGFYVRCHSEEACFRKAERVCPFGYRVVRERQLTAVTASRFGDTAVVREHPGATLMIECNGQASDDD